MTRRRLSALILCTTAACALRAQGPGRDYDLEHGPSQLFERGDYSETQAQGGFRLAVPKLGLVIRGRDLLILNDAEEMRSALENARGNGLPRRTAPMPPARRRLSPDEVRQRLQRTLQAVGRAPDSSTTQLDESTLELFRYLYCEGAIVVVQDGIEVMRCERLWISPVDDRIVVEQAELRYTTGPAGDGQLLVVRGPRLIKQGSRWVGQDLLITTCTAGEPHAAIAVREAEIFEREGEFEVVSRGQTLQVGGVRVLPLPDARFFTGSQSEFPIRSVTGGYSNLLGYQAGVVLGLPWNGTGGVLHEWLTGRPAHEFRGEWELGLGWVEKRGYPIDGALTYRAPGLYEGRLEAFWLDDIGVNIRELRTNYDGTLVDEDQRTLIRTQNRFFAGENTHVDLVAFRSSDPAVYSEFFLGPYPRDEVPETSAYLHHASGNELLTLGTRFNLNEFSYGDDRALSERFTEELPVLTYQRLADPVGTTPWGTPIVLDMESEIAQRRSDYDDLATTRVSDRSLRLDQLAEVSMPFAYGAMTVRPYLSGRGTWYDETVAGGADGRIALEGGVQAATRMSRTWRWFDDDGEEQAIRHVIAPRLTYRNRYHVDDRPGEFFRYDRVDTRRLMRLGYDDVDTITEKELVRLELRNLLQHRVDQDGRDVPRDFVFLDLAQDFFPRADRDNAGEELGLFFFDLLLRPKLSIGSLKAVTFAVYGDHDWRDGLQTFDTELQFGQVLGCNWAVEYREDALFDGAVGFGASTQLMDRWRIFARSQRDLETDRWLNHSFGLVRDDHDWSIMLSASYNPFAQETVFRIEFMPHFGKFGGARRSRFGGAMARDDFTYDY